jgi:hypothetical protein
MRTPLLAALAFALACSPARREASAPAPKPNVDSTATRRPAVTLPPSATTTPDSLRRVAPPEVAYAHGWMPLASTGVDRFLRAHKEYDGRGVAAESMLGLGAGAEASRRAGLQARARTSAARRGDERMRFRVGLGARVSS